MTSQEHKGVEYQTQNLDHLGLVAAQFDDLGLVNLINEVMPQDSEKRNVSLGHAIKAMVVNGLGFSNHTLYLMPDFYEDKPVERLLGKGIAASDINSNLLGRCLDDIYDFNPTLLYSILSSHTVKQLNLPCFGAHIDTTSIHVDGHYNSSRQPTEGVVHITKGYSRDHRPDLNQVGLQLIVENQAGIPLMMGSLNGNESDKTSFNQAIHTHIAQLQTDLGIEYLVGDSALYTASSLTKMKDIFWITRVPETLSDAKWAIESTSRELMMEQDKEAHLTLCMTYADTKQRWVIYYSPQAYQRALVSVNKQYLKLSAVELKKFHKLGQQEFACEVDAQAAIDKLKKTLKMTYINDLKINKKGRFIKRGRPGKEAAPDYYVWQVEGAVSTTLEGREGKLRQKSCFILATNQLDEKQLDENEIIRRYKKDQQKVERGFRFLKDPQFLASTLYLKKPERIMGLLMIMTLSLLIYASLEYKIRTALQENNETFPDQKERPIKNPTMRWIFQCFNGIHVLIINASRTLIMNLKEKHLQILRLMGEAFQNIYSEKQLIT